MIQIQRTIKMHKNKLIDILKKNKADHIKEYNAAVIGYKKKTTELLQKALKEVAKGKRDIHISPIRPVNREDYFDNVIGMFNNDVNVHVDLSQAEYNEYVLDQGSAAVTAFANNSMYYSAGIAGARGPKGPKGKSI